MWTSDERRRALADISNLNILVTGGTGSFGQAFCRWTLTQAKSITVYSRDEFKQGEMAALFERDPRLHFVVGDVRDLARLKHAMRGIDVVVHAAAMKQVPACEENPIEAINSNIGGSYNVVCAATAEHVPLVVALSTDKAARPTNVYGATKLIAERLFLSIPEGVTAGCVVRCGNIFGSRGSVVPLFQSQAALGAEITVTDFNMTRYSITPEEAVEMVLLAIRAGHNGEMFVPKMPSYYLTDVVEALAPDCEVREIGARAGERLHECLITETEAPDARDAGSYWIIERGRGDGTIGAKHSDHNDHWLVPADIRAMAKDYL